jgi:hypothetical protein
MRRWTLALAVVGLAACNKEQAAQDVRQTDRELASDDLITNDLTAIDAVSGADSNMAADIDVANMALNELDEDEGSSGDRGSASRRSVAPRPSESSTNASGDTAAPAADETVPQQPDDGAD